MSWFPPHSNRESRHGPFLHIHNGKGVRPWLAQRIADPGYVYTYTFFQNAGVRVVCFRCLDAMAEFDDGHGHIDYRPAEPGERCPRCERLYGTRPEVEHGTEAKRAISSR